MQNYSFADYGKPEHADLRALILAAARAGRNFHEALEDGLRGHAREHFKLWEKDLITFLEALEERDTWKERFEHLRAAMATLIDSHRGSATRNSTSSAGESSASHTS
ncbi:hypothetical protein AURDEDRAFT_174132 [Auricularia subglabra TFB-10046 SS5]|nr:hypothetical protein AURDEDRAFT_174132 [Auricularia subglabra TFB-10046 SS5]